MSIKNHISITYLRFMNVQINEVVKSEYSSFLSTGNLTKDLENNIVFCENEKVLTYQLHNTFCQSKYM